MMKKPIFERILLEAQNEAQTLLAETKDEAKRQLNEGKSKIMSRNTEELDAAIARHKGRVKYFAERQEKGLDTYREQVRQELVASVFDEVLIKLQKLEGRDLCAFITHLVAKEDVKGNEVIHVSKQNYAKYLAALSTRKNPDELDLLNKAKPGYAFTLSKEKTHIEEGFLLSGKAFDLIFDFKEIVRGYQRTNEQRIYNELFKDE
ncbi:MAG: hypothetical protein WC968_02745 [Bacilli bacterium]